MGRGIKIGLRLRLADDRYASNRDLRDCLRHAEVNVSDVMANPAPQGITLSRLFCIALQFRERAMGPLAIEAVRVQQAAVSASERCPLPFSGTTVAALLMAFSSASFLSRLAAAS